MLLCLHSRWILGGRRGGATDPRINRSRVPRLISNWCLAFLPNFCWCFCCCFRLCCCCCYRCQQITGPSADQQLMPGTSFLFVLLLLLLFLLMLLLLFSLMLLLLLPLSTVHGSFGWWATDAWKFFPNFVVVLVVVLVVTWSNLSENIWLPSPSGLQTPVPFAEGQNRKGLNVKLRRKKYSHSKPKLCELV